MTVTVVGSASRLRIFDPFVQFEHAPIVPTEIDESPLAIARSFHQPRGSAASSKGGVLFWKTMLEVRPDCVGPLVLAQMFSSTEEALCRRISALFRSGSGVPRSSPRKRNSFSYGS